MAMPVGASVVKPLTVDPVNLSSSSSNMSGNPDGSSIRVLNDANRHPGFCGFPQDFVASGDPFAEPHELCVVADDAESCSTGTFFSGYQCRWENGQCTSDADTTGEDPTCPGITDEAICGVTTWFGPRSCMWYELTPTPSQVPSMSPSVSPTFCGFPKDILDDNVDPFLEPRQNCNNLVETENDCVSSKFLGFYQCRWENGRCTSDAESTGEDDICTHIILRRACLETMWSGPRSCVWYELTPSPSLAPSMSPSAAPEFCGFPPDITGSEDPFLEPRDYCNRDASSQSTCETSSFFSSYQCVWENRRCTSGAELTGEDSTCPTIPSRRRCQATSWSGERSCIWYAPPSLSPSSAPSNEPSVVPSVQPSLSLEPSSSIAPSSSPSMTPSASNSPSLVPSISPSDEPTASSSPSLLPSVSPSASLKPSSGLTSVDSLAPSVSPSTSMPTLEPTDLPSTIPSGTPSNRPSAEPTPEPTGPSTSSPTMFPSSTKTDVPTETPTFDPTRGPTMMPTQRPTRAPTGSPTRRPTTRPATETPTPGPTREPTLGPTPFPSLSPTSNQPSIVPTVTSTPDPTNVPTMAPTPVPTFQATPVPTGFPSPPPTPRPTLAPTLRPTLAPTRVPTVVPTLRPSRPPTVMPTHVPTPAPTSTEPPTPQPTQQFAPGERIVTACQCDTAGRTCINDEVEEGSSVYICLNVQHDNVEFVDIRDLTFFQDGNIKDEPISNFDRNPQTFVSVERQHVLIRAELIEAFYLTIFADEVPSDVHADGVAILSIPDNQGNRNLHEMRLLQSNGGFTVDFAVKALEDNGGGGGSSRSSNGSGSDDNAWTWTGLFIILAVAVTGIIVLVALKRARTHRAAQAAARADQTRAAAASQAVPAQQPFMMPAGGQVMMVPAGNQMMAAAPMAVQPAAEPPKKRKGWFSKG